MVVHTPRPLILASASPTRGEMLQRAGLRFTVAPARIDEAALRDALSAEGTGPRDIADALAELKARRVSSRNPGALVIGCDQVLDLDGEALAKPADAAAARDQLARLRGRAHSLHSAAVICLDGAPLWRHVGHARMTMRSFSDTFLDAYLERNWPAVGGSVGAYRIEEEGVRLFARIEGSHFVILGLPLLELLGYLAERGEIAT